MSKIISVIDARIINGIKPLEYKLNLKSLKLNKYANNDKIY